MPHRARTLRAHCLVQSGGDRIEVVRLLSVVDSEGRPLVIPGQGGPANAGVAASQDAGRVGTLMGLPTYCDANIPTGLGTGTNEDTVLMLKADDLWLYESSVRMRVLRRWLGDIDYETSGLFLYCIPI